MNTVHWRSRNKRTAVDKHKVTQRTGVHLSIFGGGPTGDEVEYLKDAGNVAFKFDSTYRRIVKMGRV